MLEPLHMRAPSKRWLALAGIIIVSTASLAWSFTRFRRTGKIEGAPASAKQRSEVRGQRSETAPSSDRVSKAELVDSDNDGIPDVIELRTYQDRDAFKRWFTAIAETQFYQLSEQWNADQRDCAGLVRFAMREALRKHDRMWFQRMGAGYEPIAPDVRAFTLDSDVLGEKLFRTDFGTFQESDLADGKFSDFADGRTLKS